MLLLIIARHFNLLRVLKVPFLTSRYRCDDVFYGCILAIHASTTEANPINTNILAALTQNETSLEDLLIQPRVDIAKLLSMYEPERLAHQ
jgi:hypothetical protein